MSIELTTSDAVAISIGLLQIVATIALAVWTVRKTVPHPPPEGKVRLPSKLRQVLWLWFKSSWLFVVFFVFACYQAISLANGSEPLSKILVLKIAGYTAYGVLNAVSAVGFFVVEFQLSLTMRLTEVVAGINDAQRQALELQREVLELAQRAVGIGASPTERDEP